MRCGFGLRLFLFSIFDAGIRQHLRRCVLKRSLLFAAVKLISLLTFEMRMQNLSYKTSALTAIWKIDHQFSMCPNINWIAAIWNAVAQQQSQTHHSKIQTRSNVQTNCFSSVLTIPKENTPSKRLFRYDDAMKLRPQVSNQYETNVYLTMSS